MATYRMDVEYEGTRYHGWQEQKSARSVAGELRRALIDAGGDVVDLGGSGRTDAGVHALGQTAHVRLRRMVDESPFRDAVNDALPADIHVLRFRKAADAFHARHDATARAYLYQIARRRTALAKRHVWWVKRRLDAAVMAEAARTFEGMHDFRAFTERPSEQPETRVLVERAEVVEAGDLILVRLTASHFLWKMVRRIVGVLAHAGAGEVRPAEILGLLEGRPPRRAGESVASWTAPPSGLFLERVVYPGEAPLGRPAPVSPLSAEQLSGGAPFLGRSAAPVPGGRPRPRTSRPAPRRGRPR